MSKSVALFADCKVFKTCQRVHTCIGPRRRHLGIVSRTMERGLTTTQACVNGRRSSSPLFSLWHHVLTRRRAHLATEQTCPDSARSWQSTWVGGNYDMSLTRGAARLTLFCAVSTLETVQGLVIFASWAENAWRPGCHAMTLAYVHTVCHRQLTLQRRHASVPLLVLPA